MKLAAPHGKRPTFRDRLESALRAIPILIGSLTTLLTIFLARSALILPAIPTFLLLLTALTILIVRIRAVAATLVLHIGHYTSSIWIASEGAEVKPPEPRLVPADAASRRSASGYFGTVFMERPQGQGLTAAPISSRIWAERSLFATSQASVIDMRRLRGS